MVMKVVSNSDPWNIRVESHYDCVKVYVTGKTCGVIRSKDILVYPPNAWERLLGITMKSKIDKAVSTLKKWCNEQDASEQYMKDAVDRWNCE